MLLQLPQLPGTRYIVWKVPAALAGSWPGIGPLPLRVQIFEARVELNTPSTRPWPRSDGELPAARRPPARAGYRIIWYCKRFSFFFWEIHRITPPAQVGAKGSVRLLLIKNFTRFLFSCTGGQVRGISFQWFPWPWQISVEVGVWI